MTGAGAGRDGDVAQRDEHVARCVALERSYVHEVYEQCQEAPTSRPWPQVTQFLQDLEPGSIVCDVGCGNGKYLDINQSIFNVGVDRCSKLTEVAREKDNEVMMCDNLSLPFRDESFDAVLSIAVIHHFATTERRVCALRELARVLRIGGRLVISVWAMEQRNRKFESQDVLVPWQHNNNDNSAQEFVSTTATNTSEEENHVYVNDSDTNRLLRSTANGFRKRNRTRHKGRQNPNKSSSPSSSSLSSPNETCYSFVRRAIQKLAGGKRGGGRHRPWFLDSWNYCSKEPAQQRYEPDGCEDECENIQNLPIELRRIEEDDIFQSKQIPIQNNNDLYKGGLKSKSLSDIQTVKQEFITRSKSNASTLKFVTTSSTETSFNDANEQEPIPKPEIEEPVMQKQRPKLVKQKKSLNEEDGDDMERPLNQRDVVEALPDFRMMHSNYNHRRGNVFKQSSMNEELLSTERLVEKERVRKNIQKQASLNEELIYRRYRTLDSLRDSIFSVSTSKRFQIIKNGFTTKFKNSTNNIEKVAGSSIKNGFVRILQGWKTEIIVPDKNLEEINSKLNNQKKAIVTTIIEEKSTPVHTERRHSREEGSDSSKDSSLQSDTSVDSEDSFASVIFIPKQESQELTSPTPLSPAPTSPRIKSSSGPTSPRLKQSSCPTSPRLKQMPLSVYPLFKQPNSPKTAQQLKQVPSGGKVLIFSQSAPCKTVVSPISKVSDDLTNHIAVPSTSPPKQGIKSPEFVLEPVEEKGEESPDLSEKETQNTKPVHTTIPTLPRILDSTSKLRNLAEKYKLQKIPDFRPSVTRCLASDKGRSERLKQIKDLLSQRPGFGRNTRSPFPIVRRSSAQICGKADSVAKSLPRLLSLELFNPETDDMDSDSSGISSPDSIDSVISVEVPPNNNKGVPVPVIIYENEEPLEQPEKKNISRDDTQEDLVKLNLLCSPQQETPTLSPTGKSLLEAAANVASSLDDAVGAVIESSPRLKRKEIDSSKAMDVVSNDFRDLEINAGESDNAQSKHNILEYLIKTKTETQFPFDNLCVENCSDEPKNMFTMTNSNSDSWDNQCYRHLAEFAEQISENVLKEIDQYQEESKNYKPFLNFEDLQLDRFNDPYIHKLTEDIQGLTRLSAELSKERHMYLTKINSELYNSNKLKSQDITMKNKNAEKINCDSDVNISSTVLTENVSESKVSVAQKQSLNLNDLSRNVKSKSSSLRTPDQEIFTSENNLSSINEQGSNTYGLKCREISNVDSEKLDKFNSLDNLLVRTAQLIPGLSQESTDTGDISERTNSSECSRGDSRLDTATTDGGSTASLSSCKDWVRPRKLADGRSSSEDATEARRSPLVRQHASVQEPLEVDQAGGLNVSLSDTSQESLPSDSGGGAITYHRYYHVFREGELDQLIENYVDNLHIIKSYYDHASWCVVAEKVQVWTI